jgi:hypothetical protein
VTYLNFARPVDRFSWLWLAVGLALLPFSTVHAELPLAAWLAPIFILRFARTQSMRLGLPVVVLVSGAALAFACRDFYQASGSARGRSAGSSRYALSAISAYHSAYARRALSTSRLSRRCSCANCREVWSRR